MKKGERQVRRLRVMMEELGRLRDEGVLSAEEVAGIADRIPALPTVRSDWGRIVRIAFSTLSVLFLGFAVFLLLSHNWKFLAPWIKTAIVLGSFLTVSAVALLLRCREKRLGSDLVFLAGGILYGVGIFLIGQIFNIDSYTPQGIWLWALGVWTVAFLVNYDILHLFAAILLAVWVGMTSSYDGVGPGPFRDLYPVLPNAAWTLPILAGIGFFWSYRRRQLTASGTYALVLFFWVALLPELCDFCCSSVNVFWQAALGGIFVTWSGFLAPKSLLRKMIFVLGFVWLTVSLFTMTFYANNKWWSFDVTGKTPAMLCFVFFLFFLFYSTLLWRGRRRLFGQASSWDKSPSSDATTQRFRLDCVLAPEMIGYLILGIITIRLFIMTVSEEWKTSDETLFLTVFTVFANLTLLGLIFGLMTRRGKWRATAFWTGFACLILWAVFRYLDLFGDFGGMLGAAVFFVLLAVAVFVGGGIWSRRLRNEPIENFDDAEEIDSVADFNTGTEIVFDNESDVQSAGACDNAKRLLTLMTERRARVLLALIVLAELGVLTGMILSRTIPFIGASEITVETEPVDPRDMFRGDYVTLGYSFERVGNEPNRILSPPLAPGRTVYVIMKQDAKTGIWKETAISPERPQEGVFLKGVCRKTSWRQQFAFGISTFFVPEGEGKEIEDAMRERKVVVDLLVTPAGNARVKNVRVIDNIPSLPAPDANTDAS